MVVAFKIAALQLAGARLSDHTLTANTTNPCDQAQAIACHRIHAAELLILHASIPPQATKTDSAPPLVLADLSNTRPGICVRCVSWLKFNSN
jgi:hypothetical protein